MGYLLIWIENCHVNDALPRYTAFFSDYICGLIFALII